MNNFLGHVGFIILHFPRTCWARRQLILFRGHMDVDTPTDMCLCKFGIEDTRHFLLSCPFYASKRGVMVRSVSAILLKKKIELSSQFTCQ